MEDSPSFQNEIDSGLAVGRRNKRGRLCVGDLPRLFRGYVIDTAHRCMRTCLGKCGLFNPAATEVEDSYCKASSPPPIVGDNIL